MSGHLATITKELDPSNAAMMRASLEPMFEAAERWEKQAALILSAPENDRDSAKQAEALRKTIKKSRGVVEEKRKEMKSGLLTLGAAIDAAAKMYVAMVTDTERQLEAREKYQENLKRQHVENLRLARQETLTALEFTIPVAGLGEMSEEAFALCLEDAKSAKESRDRVAREEEEARVEAARILAERRAQEEIVRRQAEADRVLQEEAQKAENERIKAESERLKAEAREAKEALRKQEEAALEALRQQEETARQALQEEVKQTVRRGPLMSDMPDREKFLVFAEQLRKMPVPKVQSVKSQSLLARILERVTKLATDVEEAAEGV